MGTLRVHNDSMKRWILTSDRCLLMFVKQYGHKVHYMCLTLSPGLAAALERRKIIYEQGKNDEN